MDSKSLGKLGEKIASSYLQKKGYQILDKNYSSKFISGPKRGEIDIVVKPKRSIFNIFQGKKDNPIHFIEVKTLASREQFSVISPEEKVNFEKTRKIIKTAQEWLTENKISLESKWQIDIIAIKIDPKGKKAKIRHFKNAIIGD